MRIPQRSSKAFTLIELIVVIVILGILALIAIPTFGKVIGKSQDESTLSSLRAMARNAQALKAMDQAAAWGSIPADSIGEVNVASSAGVQAAKLAAVVDDGLKNPLAGQVTYFVKNDGVVLSMLSGSKKICVVGFDSATMGKGLCQVPTAGATTSLGSSLSSGASSVLPPSTGSGGTPAPTVAYSTVYGWGVNDSGQLATSNSVNYSAPTTSSFGGPVQSVALTEAASCALMGDATVKCVGALRQNGTTTANTTPATVAGLAGVTALTSNQSTFYALLSDGTVKAWGQNGSGIGNATVTSTAIPTPVENLSGVKALASGNYTAYALLQDGTVKAWGYNSDGQLGDGTTASSRTPVDVKSLTGVQSIGAGGFTAYAVLADGSVKAWGKNNLGQLGNGTTSTTATSTPATITSLSNVAKVTGSYYSSYALMKDGSVKAWGYNADGQLGNGTQTDSSLPVTVNVSNVADVAGGYYFAYALLKDGSVRSWGANSNGQLGIGSTALRSTTPTLVGLTGVKGIATQTSADSIFAWK